MDRDNKPEAGSGQSWIYSSLIQTARPVASLAAKLGILPYTYNIYDRDFLNLQYNEEENKKLKEIWIKAENANENENDNTQIGFISLQLRSHKDDETKISQMGMSKWRSDGASQIASVHCHVEQDTAVGESSYPQLIASDFMSGDTEVITESDVGPWLEATFRSFQNYQDITCLIGHDIRRILHLVQPCWRVPSGVIILDTRAIWEFQTQASQHPSLRQTLEGVVLRGCDTFLADNTGNGARLILDLLQHQGRRAERTAHPLAGPPARASNIVHEHRRALQHSEVMTPADWSRL